MLRSVLLLVSIAAYVVAPDDIVWHFIKAGQHARLLEHLAFGTAACLLGTALLLRVRNSHSGKESAAQERFASLLQFVGLGSLLPLPGFLLLLIGQFGIELLVRQRPRVSDESDALPTRTWAGAMAVHAGLCCAFVSMIVFSVVLIDRVADILFATSALVSIGATAASVLRSRKRRS